MNGGKRNMTEVQILKKVKKDLALAHKDLCNKGVWNNDSDATIRKKLRKGEKIVIWKAK